MGSAYAGYLEVRRLGRTPYAEAYQLQQELVAARIAGEVGDLCLLTEHEPVITIGRGTRDLVEAGLGESEIPLVEVERGGEATYHGPGQIVAYPILELGPERRDLHRYLRDLEEVVIRVLSEVGVEAGRRDAWTGVWVGDRKVCSIGVAVRRWVTYHGLALNLSTELGAFGTFKPCGLAPEVMGNVADHVELPPVSLLFEVLIVKHLCEVFELELPPVPQAKATDGATTLPPDDQGWPQLPILPE